jgi:hypothetical protein
MSCTGEGNVRLSIGSPAKTAFAPAAICGWAFFFSARLGVPFKHAHGNENAAGADRQQGLIRARLLQALLGALHWLHARCDKSLCGTKCASQTDPYTRLSRRICGAILQGLVVWLAGCWIGGHPVSASKQETSWTEWTPHLLLLTPDVDLLSSRPDGWPGVSAGVINLKHARCFASG